MADDPAFPSDVTTLYEQLGWHREQLSRFMLVYQSGINEVETKLRILQQEFLHLDSYNPIEHLSTRLKTPESILEKARRKGCAPQIESLRSQITDIAGVRVVCSFVSDVYRVQQMLCSQQDVHLHKLKDYVAHPKPNGYRSLHAIIEIPVFLSDRVANVPVEVQFRTIAMDTWASLEHKIHYKYAAEVPTQLLDELQAAADTAAQLDSTMERLHSSVRGHATRSSWRERYAALSDETVADFIRYLGHDNEQPAPG